MKIFTTVKQKLGALIAGASLIATSATAAVDLTAIETKLNDGAGQLEGYAPAVIGFVLVMIIIGGIIKMTKRAA